MTLSALLSSPPLFGWGEYDYISVQSFCFCDWANHLSYAVFMILCCFGGPCSVMTVCNIFIYRAVRASRRKVAIRIHQATSENKSQEKDEKALDRISESSQRISSECNSENQLIVNKDVKPEAAPNFNLDSAKQNNDMASIKANNNNVEKSEKSNRLLHPLRSFKLRKQKQKRINALNTIVGDELETSDVTSTQMNDQTANRISNTSSSTTLKPKSQSTKLKRREEHRLAMSLIVVVIVFVICWLPFCISMLLMIFAKEPVEREFHMFTLVVGYANSCCNPIIYGLMNKRFASGFKDLYCFWKNRSFRMPVVSSP